MGMPAVSCADRMVEAIGDEIYIMGYVMCTISGVMLFMVIISMPMCHISKKKQKEEEEKQLEKELKSEIEFSNL